MQQKLQSLWHYRPRFLTMLVFSGIAVLIVLANLSDELTVRTRRGADFTVFDLGEPVKSPTLDTIWNLSYGWPLLWRQYIGDTSIPLLSRGVIGWSYSKWQLAANAAIWLVMATRPFGSSWQRCRRCFARSGSDARRYVCAGGCARCWRWWH